MSEADRPHTSRAPQLRETRERNQEKYTFEVVLGMGMMLSEELGESGQEEPLREVIFRLRHR